MLEAASWIVKLKGQSTLAKPLVSMLEKHPSDMVKKWFVVREAASWIVKGQSTLVKPLVSMLKKHPSDMVKKCFVVRDGVFIKSCVRCALMDCNEGKWLVLR